MSAAGSGRNGGGRVVTAPGDAEDRELLQAHVEGDKGAFTELVRRHRDRMWYVALRTLRDREEASDAVQEALISAFRNAASYRGDAAVSTWLHRVVVNACLDRLRRERARPKVPLGDYEVAGDHDDHDCLEIKIDLHAALSCLPEAQRAAIVMVDLLDLSVAEAAAELGVAEGTVKSRCSRGRTELARIMRDRLGENQPSSPRIALGHLGNRRSRSRVAPSEVWVTGTPGPATSGGGP
jgi:RNA polymerase sigma-70 factor (ECF subfamily)